jgi:RNA polymerase sigma-70 factor (ECF subfamily)
LNECFAASRNALHFAAYRILGNHSDAEDVVQDTFIQAYRRIDTFRGECAMRTWLCTIAINQARNRYWYFRRRYRHTTVSLDYRDDCGKGRAVADRVPENALDPADNAAHRDGMHQVMICFEKLPENHREIVVSRCLRHLSYEEIATALSISVGTVKSRLSRARQSLRLMLAAL